MTIKKEPLVSVIVPCYNQGKYIFEALESVQRQTFPNFECIIINDGSTDDSLEIAQKFCRNDSRFICYDKKNEGVSIARNYGISHSHGIYILPLDADDKIDPKYLDEALSVFRSNPEVKLVYSNTRLFGKINADFDLPPYDYNRLIHRNHIVCTALFRRCDFDKTNGYNPNMREGLEDWDFWLSFLQPSDVVYKIDKFLFLYRKKSKSRNIDARANLRKLRYQIWQNHRDVYAQNFLDPSLSEEYRLLEESREYRLGKVILTPIRKLLKLFESK